MLRSVPPDQTLNAPLGPVRSNTECSSEPPSKPPFPWPSSHGRILPMSDPDQEVTRRPRERRRPMNELRKVLGLIEAFRSANKTRRDFAKSRGLHPSAP